jgi:hypothetical protein
LVDLFTDCHASNVLRILQSNNITTKLTRRKPHRGFGRVECLVMCYFSFLYCRNFGCTWPFLTLPIDILNLLTVT